MKKKVQRKRPVATAPRVSAKPKVQTKQPVTKKAPKREGRKTREPEERPAHASEQQKAIDEILRVMASSPGDVQPVLDAVAERAARLCEAPHTNILIRDGDMLRPRAFYRVGGGATQTTPSQLTRRSVTGRAVLESKTIHLGDIVPLLDTEYPDRRKHAQRLGIRAILAVPLMCEGKAYGGITIFRREPQPFSPDQIALVETFARQAAIAIESARLFEETKRLLKETEQRNAELAIINSVQQGLAAELHFRAIIDLVGDKIREIFNQANLEIRTYDPQTKLVHFPYWSQNGRRIAVESRPLGETGFAAHVIRTRETLVINDSMTSHMERYGSSPLPPAKLPKSGVMVPLVMGNQVRAIIALGDMEHEHAFSASDVSLLQTLASAMSVAMENVRLFDETKETLQQQTATSEILRVISSSPTDVQPVFDSIAERAATLCGARFGFVTSFDGEWIHMRATYGPGADEHRKGYPIRPGPGAVAARAIRDRATVQIEDMLADREYAHKEAAVRQGFRSALGVPMMRDGQVVGCIAIARPETGAVPERLVRLLQTFADQAVIAIENVRLFNETKEALERQTATAEILRVISESPADVQPVFDAIVRSAMRAFGALTAVATRVVGDSLHLAAFSATGPDGEEALKRLYPMPMVGTLAEEAARTGQIIAVNDVLTDPRARPAMRKVAQARGFRSMLVAPMLREGLAIGTINISRAEPGGFSDHHQALIKTFADQAVIAIENMRLLNELKTRTAQLSRSVNELRALGEVGQAVSSTLDLETVLRTIVSRANQLGGMDGGAIFEYDDAREEFSLRATDRLPDELVAALGAAPIPRGEGAIGGLAVTGEPVQIRDIVEEGAYQSRARDILLRIGSRALLAVPLLREDRLLGGLVVNRKRAGEFASEEIDLLKTFATQSALAIQNARLYREIEQKSRELESASRHKSEFLANMSHELRTPLNAIIGFSEVLSERMFGDINAKQAEYIGDISESGQHLLSLINDILDLSKIEAGRMELELSDFDLPRTIENTLILVRERALRRRIALERAVDQRLGMVRADERKVKQVLLNLLSNALKFTPEGGQIAVRANVQDGVAEISVTDTGVGIAPEDHEAVFEEFRQVGTAAKKVEGTGLGLAISKKFIELHGGRIWVASQLGKGSTFAFTLPLQQFPLSVLGAPSHS